jgi:hypothetical protein
MIALLEAAVGKRGSSKPDGLKGWRWISETLVAGIVLLLSLEGGAPTPGVEKPYPARYNLRVRKRLHPLLKTSERPLLVGARSVYRRPGMGALLLFAPSTLHQTII